MAPSANPRTARRAHGRNHLRVVAVALLAAAALGAAAAPARAADLEIGMEDERLLLSDPLNAAPAVQAWKALGVDVVRIHAQWWMIAPGRDETRPPPGFRAGDPRDPHYDWHALDGAVAVARAAGLRVMLTVTGPGPLWTSRDPSRGNARWEPSPDAFGRFALAVASRYRKDVDRYLIWNEPNQPGWLQPQSECARRVCTPVAPHVYRGLVRAAVRAIHAADPGSEVLLGELAPIGRPTRSRNTPLPPLPFLRAMGCVNTAYRPLRSGRCAGFRPAVADAFGYHPHPVLNPPDQANPDRADAQFADLGRLFHVLNKLTDEGRLVTPAGRFQVYLTEFGYQTSPPDRAIGITLAQQTRYLQQAAYVAWRWARVRSLSFYQWEDEPVVDRGTGTRAYSGWQSGLHFLSGAPKPALSTFAAPFVVDHATGRATALLWGQVRPAAQPTVTVLERPRGAEGFRAIAQARTARDGSWSLRIRVPPGAAYRYRWVPAPTATEPLPATRLSGIVDMAIPQRSRLRAAAALARR